MCATETCDRCDHSGYSPSAAVMLSRGELECPDCDGYGTPHNAGLCDCPDSDASDHECEVPCPTCDGSGVVECEHETTEAR